MTSSPGSPCAKERVRRRGAWTPPSPAPTSGAALGGVAPPPAASLPFPEAKALASPDAELQALLQARQLPWTSWGQRAPGVAVLGPCLPCPPPPVRVAAPRLPGELCSHPPGTYASWEAAGFTPSPPKGLSQQASDRISTHAAPGPTAAS